VEEASSDEEDKKYSPRLGNFLMFDTGKHERNTSVQKRGSRAVRLTQEEETKQI
jgi:hypothetical protein